MNIKVKTLIATLLLTATVTAEAQYAEHSVLREGDWWKIGIRTDGIYKIGSDDIAAL